MRLFFLIIILSQLINSLFALAEKVKKDSRGFNVIKWEKVQENKSNNQKQIIWKSYNDDESNFQNQVDLIPEIEKLNDYRNEDEDILKKILNEKNRLLNYGGISVSNALLPETGISQINLGYDSKGNLFGFYGYSFSDLFQLELSIGSFNDVNLVDNKFFSLKSKFLSNNNLNYRVGGKFLILSPANHYPFWMAFRTSIGTSENSKHGYLITELINTFKLNDAFTFNVNPRYYFGQKETFGAVGLSSHINLGDNLKLIPELNILLNNDSNFNSTLGLRYSFRRGKSIDLYYSNAASIQDLGQILEDKEYRFGIKLNFIY